MDHIVSNSKHWIALYTRAHREKAVATQLHSLGVECYVPVRSELRQWSDRKKKVEIPLLPSYVLVQIEPQNYRHVYQADGIVRIVMFRGRIAVVRQEEVDLLRAVENAPERAEVISRTFYSNEEVEIISGAFARYRGKVLRGNGSCRVAIEIEELGHVVLVQVPWSIVRQCGRTEAA